MISALSKRPRRVLLALTIALLPGCDRSPLSMLRTNEPPGVTLTSQVASPGSRTVQVKWKGEDVDGRVDHYLVALDPALIDHVDDSWTRTTAVSRTVDFSKLDGDVQGERKLHRLVVRAVDDAGAMSPPSWVGGYADNIPPSVQITNPVPNPFDISVGPNIPISWRGEDPDGVFRTTPVKYKFRLFSASDPELTFGPEDPDSIRRLYTPSYAGWDSLPGDTTSVRYTNLTPGSHYLFVVTAFDEFGDENPLFSLSTNMLRFRVGFPGTVGPRFNVFNEFFNYTYPSGGDGRDYPVPVEVPTAQPIGLNWFADPMVGTAIAAYRYALDPVNLDDDSEWSPWNIASTSAVLGPFNPPGVKREKHSLYIEAMDSIENTSLARIDLIAVPATLSEDLLVINDTRFEPSKVFPGQTCPTLPTGPWPVASELDTILFARGNVDWRCQGTITPIPKTKPGLFSAYRPDTLGTRTRIRYMRFDGDYSGAGNPVPLSVLNRYRHVVWITDGLGATYTQPTDLVKPGTALRYMNAPNQMNTLAAYVNQGGKVWLAGGGAGYAAGINFNDRNNDIPTVTFSSITSTFRELGPGRFMYDFAHWQSEYRTTNASLNIFRALGRYDSAVVAPPPYPLPPPLLERKTPTSDPLAQEAPTRSSSSFYQSTMYVEFLQEPNHIIEDIDPDPGVENEQSTLDTLYRATGAQLFKPVQHVPMTYYHGPVNNVSFVFSGFPFWNFKRTQGQALVDFVLRDLWGLTPSAPAPVATRDP